jgi:hypothetical protein
MSNELTPRGALARLLRLWRRFNRKIGDRLRLLRDWDASDQAEHKSDMRARDELKEAAERMRKHLKDRSER